ncbi:MAG: hypothetical protein ACJAUG_001212 [Halioglobus sp.]|jgi:hypothetical protein
MSDELHTKGSSSTASKDKQGAAMLACGVVMMFFVVYWFSEIQTML